MSELSVLYSVQDGVGIITLNRPAVLNAVNKSLAAALADAAEKAAQDSSVWVIVVSGAGRAFSSGMDRAALSAGRIEEAFYRHWIRGLNCLEDVGKPVLAAIHGYCIGGGLQLALACDFRLATADAVLGLGATRHGLIPDGAVLRLARVIGIGRAKELALLNDDVPVRDAQAMGLVNWVCAPGDLDATVERLIARVRTAAPTATAHTKRLLHESFHRDPRTMIEEVLRSQNACMATWETEEANRAWQEKREPRYHPKP